MGEPGSPPIEAEVRPDVLVARRGRRPLGVGLLVGLVGLAFADTSIVALALPRIYATFATTIVTVSWVLTGYAAAVTVVGFGSALAHRRLRPAVLVGVGLAVLAATCLAAGLARTLPVLLVSRCCQGVGAALLLTGAVPVLAEALGERAGRLAWARAAALGLAVGPALGGVLTQLFDWRSIFLAQVPVTLIGLAILAARPVRAATASAGPPSPGAGSMLGLMLLSGGLVGALFLSVLLVIDVWRLPPLAGAGVVSALPAGMLLGQPLARRLVPGVLALTGTVGLSGGLVALALLPAATAPWVMVALLLCGLGWALLDELFESVPTDSGHAREVAGSGAGLRAGGVSTAARHAGLVIGLVLIAPVLAGALGHAGERAALSGTAVVLDARLPLADKVTVAGALRDGLAAADRGQVPDIAGVVDRSAGRSPATRELGDRLATRLRDVLTRAFRASFGIAAALAGAALLPALMVLGRRRRAARGTARGVARGTSRGVETAALFDPPVPRPSPAADRTVSVPAQLLVTALVPVLAAALLVTQVSAGATRFGTSTLADPCRAAADPYPGGGSDALEQRLILSTLNGAACSLHVSREALVLSLDGRSRFGTSGLAPAQVEPALRAGLLRAVDDSERRGDLPGLAAFALRQLVSRMPLDWLARQLGLPALGGRAR